MIICGIAGYKLSSLMRTEFKLLNLSIMESERYKDVFTYLLPAFVRNRVKEGDREIAED